MEKNTISFNSTVVETFNDASMNRIISLLGRKKKYKYKDNPPVAAIVNGELRSLMDIIPQNAEITTVNLFTELGRRVYRKTLCFLLCWASSELYKDKTLLIGHSMGDGYYFSYKEKFNYDIEALKAKMREAIDRDYPIDFMRLTSDEALRYATSHNLEDTEKLLKTRNDGSYLFSRLGSCLELYYEPMLPSTKYLEVWELVGYEDGLLLRYPQARDPLNIQPFANNELLFNIFKTNKRSAEVLGIKSLGCLNEKQINGDIEDTILLCETVQRRKFIEIGKTIAERGAKIVLIAGPSSSGKTTSALKLCNELRINGLNPIKISLDNYYKPTEEVPLDENGNRNFEVIEALNTDLFNEQLRALMRGEEVYLAQYSIKTREHSFKSKPTRLEDNSVLVIEGIHGLNPSLIPGIDQSLVYKIYISALTTLSLDSRCRISSTDNRILRRLVRDYRTRGLDAVETLTRWPSVERGEKEHIFPYQNNADVMVNSALEYELGILTVFATPLLRSVPKEAGEAYTTARRLLSFIKLVYPITPTMVPTDSILREFIGGSVYDVK